MLHRSIRVRCLSLALIVITLALLSVSAPAASSVGASLSRGQVTTAGASGRPTAASTHRLASTATLQLQAVFTVIPTSTPCPAGMPTGDSCFQMSGPGSVRGLGQVTESYLVATTGDPGVTCIPFRTGPDSLTVAGKGTLTATITVSSPCNGTPTGFSFTGGSGAYASASGSGTFSVPSDEDDTTIDLDDMGQWTDTWTGTLTVPGLTFDLTPPTISGAASKVVHVPKTAKFKRVRFNVTAEDNVDGSVPVKCKPHSGSRFRIGRTKVSCNATDSSANTATASFTITVKHRRH